MNIFDSQHIVLRGIEMWEQSNRILQQRNLNGSQLSKMAGVNRSFFSDLRTGKEKNLSWPNMCKIADALGVSLDEFRYKGENMPDITNGREKVNAFLKEKRYQKDHAGCRLRI